MLDQSYKKNSTAVTRGGSFGECFLKATGIGMGIGFIKDLSKKTISRGMLRKVITTAVKIGVKAGTRTLGGVGLALLAAEMAWCMYG